MAPVRERTPNRSKVNWLEDRRTLSKEVGSDQKGGELKKESGENKSKKKLSLLTDRSKKP